jgi:arginyl-tRNA--protein-N-Asp/Glu arginylyltransferase
MKLYFDHILGKQKNKDFVFSLVSASFKEEEWDWAFENGWAPTAVWFDSNFTKTQDIIWYQSRQSRINLSEYRPNPKTKKLLNNKLLNIKVTDTLSDSLDCINEVYLRYCNYKDFGDMLSIQDITTLLFHNKSTKNYYISFYIESKLVAITKLSLWSKSLFSEVFWWNYKNPEFSLGKLSFYLESELAKSLNINYLYTGISYNSDSIYKSQKNGFQFWTGRNWLSDTDYFIDLCKYDDSIETIEELHSYQYSYLNNLKVQ